jgi:hypothetical protein
MTSLREQLRHHSVALISLIVALATLAYVTWRNERTEDNRTVRTAAVEILTQLSELERVVFVTRHDRASAGGDARAGWSSVIVIRDLADVMPERVLTQAAVLQKVWDENWQGLGAEDGSAAERIDSAADEVRKATLEALRSLE